MTSSTDMTRILRKLTDLAASDPGLKLFGADKHKYHLAPTLSNEEVSHLEAQYKMTLPEGYRRFLLEVGDGGAGPYYGLHSLSEAIKYSGTTREPDILSRPFPLEKALDLFEKCGEAGSWDDYFARIETDEKYYDKVRRCVSRFNKPHYTQGTLYLCDYGDGIAFRLVVTGPQVGNIWIDDRVGGFGGLFPLSPEGKASPPTSFLKWYENWLDKAARTVESGGSFEYA
jgi:hypothetical protein